MTKGTFNGMVKATPEKFQFSVKVPETSKKIRSQQKCDNNMLKVQHPLNTRMSA
jgi:uncharacterized protein YecE (DUF72 family)